MKKVGIYNPLASSFSTTYDVLGTGKPETFTIEPYTVGEFEPVVAEHVRKHLITEIINYRDINPLYTEEVAEISAETYLDEHREPTETTESM